MFEDRVCDKAKYHQQGCAELRLDEFQAFVHTGLFVGWLVERGLISAEHEELGAAEIAAFRARQMTGPRLFEWWGGALIGDMLTDGGNAFVSEYFDVETGAFAHDYEEVLSSELLSIYRVEDTWENFEKLSKRIDGRFLEWNSRRQAAPS